MTMLWMACAGSAGAQTATHVAKHGDWTLFRVEGNAASCFAASQPKDSDPKGVKRDAVYFYVSAWPSEGVKSEISVKFGFPVKKGSEPLVSIGTAAFKLFIKEDKAFVADPTQELKLLDAMRKGAKMQILATSERGTNITDTYSLTGLSPTLQAMASSCP